MSRTIKDEELRAYQKKIGAKQYRALFMYERSKANRFAKNDTRYSRKNYVNSTEKLDTIKQKYKNGITQEIMEEWLGK
jgi:hypothetical protein